MGLLPSHQFIEQLFGLGGVQQLLQRLGVGEQTVDLSGLIWVIPFRASSKAPLLQLALQLGRIGSQLLASHREQHVEPGFVHLRVVVQTITTYSISTKFMID